MFITNGWLADVVVVVAITNREAKSAAHGISLFLVDSDTPGFKKSWLMKKIGMGASVSVFLVTTPRVDIMFAIIFHILLFDITRTQRVSFSKMFAFQPVLD
jgi:hypothetical protein